MLSSMVLLRIPTAAQPMIVPHIFVSAAVLHLKMPVLRLISNFLNAGFSWYFPLLSITPLPVTLPTFLRTTFILSSKSGITSPLLFLINDWYLLMLDGHPFQENFPSSDPQQSVRWHLTVGISILALGACSLLKIHCETCFTDRWTLAKNWDMYCLFSLIRRKYMTGLAREFIDTLLRWT